MNRRRALVGANQKLWLYKDGDECVDVTGGWVGKTYNNVGSQEIPTVTHSINSISAKVVSTWGGGMLFTRNRIDVSQHAKIFFVVTTTNRYNTKNRDYYSEVDAIFSINNENARKDYHHAISSCAASSSKPLTVTKDLITIDTQKTIKALGSSNLFIGLYMLQGAGVIMYECFLEK